MPNNDNRRINNSNTATNIQNNVGPHLNQVGEGLIAPALEKGLSSAISTQLSQPNSGASNLPQQKTRPQSPQTEPNQTTPSEENVKNSIENLKVLLRTYVGSNTLNESKYKIGNIVLLKNSLFDVNEKYEVTEVEFKQVDDLNDVIEHKFENENKEEIYKDPYLYTLKLQQNNTNGGLVEIDKSLSEKKVLTSQIKGLSS